MSQASRREFLRRAGAFGLLRAAGPLGLQLAGIGAAAAASAPQDYRAIVCLFMYGANDAHNTVIPLTPENYGRYAEARSSLAIAREELLPLGTSGLGLHPALLPVQKLYADGKAAILANVGPLIQPIPDAQAFNGSNIPRPPKLFSHNDQQAVWQAFSPEGAKRGWGGRIADMLAAGNGNALFTAVSASENAVFLASDRAPQYQISPSGAIAFNRASAGSVFGSPLGAAALRAQIAAAQPDLLDREYRAVVERSVEAEALLSRALARLPESDPRLSLPEDLARNSLVRQLRIIARLIGVHDDPGLNEKRQVFFVSLGGFDTHDNQLNRQAELLDSVARSVAWFQQVMVQLGMADQVTLFTASDFGRALLSNGDGSDHGWGGHHFIVGGAVRGGRIYGEFPDVALKTRTDVGNGRLLPTTAVDQYAATLARWMGVAERDLPQVLPNIGHFPRSDLGFLAS
ncbi:DUF1501 domain-containing protein [Uliginosibacterium paludis]|uniref:DUF1501 domain-containing protein n=1 Tax=Uliginosibacterium paludis TaxID=1615952 RepID=A0ABV2CK05_9RHOO